MHYKNKHDIDRHEKFMIIGTGDIDQVLTMIDKAYELDVLERAPPEQLPDETSQ